MVVAGKSKNAAPVPASKRAASRRVQGRRGGLMARKQPPAVRRERQIVGNFQFFPSRPQQLARHLLAHPSTGTKTAVIEAQMKPISASTGAADSRQAA